MSSTSQPLTRSSVLNALPLIAPYIHTTPVVTSTTLSSLSTPTTGPRLTLFLKCENLQKIGAFKIRGATHAIARLSDAELSRGVVTHSSGNHAQALSLAAAEAGRRRGIAVPAYVVMPAGSTPSKIAATRGYGATVTFSGPTAAEREAVVREVQQRTGAVLVPPYDHPDVIVGQGTVALEFLEQVKAMVAAGLDVIVAPCGGGGLLAGIATACEGTGVRVYGAEPREGADDCVRGLKEGKRVEAVKSSTVADGLRTPVGFNNWGVISNPEKVHGVFSVGEEEIMEAMRLVVERCKILIEPSSAVPVAVVLGNPEWRAEIQRVFAGREEVRVGIVISGGNTTIDKIIELFSKKTEKEA
ncbi:tryptophan synthase beta subunit-like PLP-dependent enzyme [Tricharina praecox]|uniref:tryptophan synthase beta subunit-like PLP-dependent enzyme n=1 Tax=Tricharina praecox TaxID=43433 RepID=UPI00221F957E|nr:tryptophan synthase beta subunit-like PLP-dependent enzyme [Tricharina praecox]KAI5851899.1 tryptophan synthase beta subunit-like PLP-dependent enzyme [Tricharina praecox]